MKFTELEDLGNYALDVRNRDTVNGYVARFRNGSDELLLSLVKEYVTVGKQIVSQVADGTPPFVLTSTTRVPNLNADMVDGHNAGNSPYSVPVLDANGDLPLAQIPDTLTGKDADSVDGAEPGNSEGDLLVLGSGALVPLANLPATLTGKDADSVDGHEPGVGQGDLPILGAGGLLPVAHLPTIPADSIPTVNLGAIPDTLTGKDADSVDGREPGTNAGDLVIRDSGGKVPLDDDSVDDTIVGARVPYLAHRQGGSASHWHTGGTNLYIPGAVHMQVGSASVTIASGNYEGSTTVTMPQAFAGFPLVFVTLYGQSLDPEEVVTVSTTILSSSKFNIRARRNTTGATRVLTVFWLAIGPEA